MEWLEIARRCGSLALLLMMDLLRRKLEEAEAKNQEPPDPPDDPSD
jgi:hypothetical protein